MVIALYEMRTILNLVKRKEYNMSSSVHAVLGMINAASSGIRRVIGEIAQLTNLISDARPVGAPNHDQLDRYESQKSTLISEQKGHEQDLELANNLLTAAFAPGKSTIRLAGTQVV